MERRKLLFYQWRIQGRPGARPPKGPVSFVLTYKLELVHSLRGWCPRMGNPGSATVYNIVCGNEAIFEHRFVSVSFMPFRLFKWD